MQVDGEFDSRRFEVARRVASIAYRIETAGLTWPSFVEFILRVRNTSTLVQLIIFENRSEHEMTT